MGVKRKGKRSEWQGQDRDGVVWILTVEYYVKGTRAHKLFSTIFHLDLDFHNRGMWSAISVLPSCSRHIHKVQIEVLPDLAPHH